MKHLIIFFLLLIYTTTDAYAQTLFTYGKHSVQKDEFLRAYHKNNSSVTDKERSIREYVDLYTHFKLKVRAALDLGMDTSEQMKTDLLNFRQQIESNYLEDAESMKLLLHQAFERSQKDLQVLHFFTSSPLNASSNDTLKAFQLTEQLFSQLKSGNQNYDQIIVRPQTSFTDLGYITSFTLPYPYENLVYGLEVGEVSKPYRTQKGWHIFKVVASRKSMGKRKVAQILFSIPPAADASFVSRIQKKADSVYALIRNGADFSSLAIVLSEDKISYMNGGELPAFGTGAYDPSFENQVVRLKNINDVSAPFSTTHGIHIVKLLEVKPTPEDIKDESFQNELRQKILLDSRAQWSKDKFADMAIKKTGIKKVSVVKESDLFRFADTVKSNPSADLEKIPLSKKPVLQIKKDKILGAEWLQFVMNTISQQGINKAERNINLWKKFQAAEAVEYYRKHLEEYSPDFAYQMEEFKEGNLLFEIMEKKVWGKASADSIGLRNHYLANKAKYLWAPSADMVIIRSVSESPAKDAMESLKTGINWKGLIESRTGELQADSGRFEISSMEWGDMKPIAGAYSPIISNSDGSYTFCKFLKVYEGGEQRGFEDAKGMVINDYQAVLEKEWIAELRKKYPVIINEKVLKEMLK